MLKSVIEDALKRADNAGIEAIAAAHQRCDAAVEGVFRRLELARRNIEDLSLPPDEQRVQLAKLESEAEAAEAAARRIQQAEVKASWIARKVLTTTLWEEAAKAAAATGDPELTHSVALRAARKTFTEAAYAAVQAGDAQAAHQAVLARDAAFAQADAAYDEALAQAEG